MKAIPVRQTCTLFQMKAELLDSGTLYQDMRDAIEVDDFRLYIHTARDLDITLLPDCISLAMPSRRRTRGLDTPGGVITISRAATSTVVQLDLEQVDIEPDAVWDHVFNNWLTLRRRSKGQRGRTDPRWIRLEGLDWSDIPTVADDEYAA